MSNLVVDASAVLAVLFAERGAEIVIPRLPGVMLSSVNYAEVISRSLDVGKPLEDTIRETNRLPIRVVPFDAEQAEISASLRPVTKSLGLGLGDRACLGLGLARQASVLTGDTDWADLKLPIEVILFRKRQRR